MDKRKSDTIKLLSILNNKYDLYSFVLKYQFRSINEITEEAIDLLKKYSTQIIIYEKKDAEAHNREKEFVSFIMKNIDISK